MLRKKLRVEPTSWEERELMKTQDELLGIDKIKSFSRRYTTISIY